MDIEQIDKKLKSVLSERRYNHSIGVMHTACELAHRYGADVNKAKIAGLLHDCAKEIDKEDMLRMCYEMEIPLDDVKRTQKGLLHADIGAELLKKEYGIYDEEIYNAVKCHTMGRSNMTKLDKIIYLSDYIEPGRKYFEGLDVLRELCREDLDLAMVYAIDLSIGFILAKGKTLHKQTIITREYFKNLLDNRKGKVAL